MFALIVVFPVVVLVGVFYVFRPKFKILPSCCLAVWTAMLVSFATVLVLYSTPPVYSNGIEYSKVKIVAMTKPGGSNDTFLELLKIKGDQYYFFYEKMDGGNALTFIRKSSAIIRNGHGSAYLAQYKRVWNQSGWFNFLVPAFLRTIVENARYVIHIPKGSIGQEINLSLPK